MRGTGRTWPWLAALAALVPTGASAHWMRAETRHFIVYDDARESDVRKLATDLERFDSFLRLFHSRSDTPGAESNKLTVYVLGDMLEVNTLYGKGAGMAAGFYNGRASGSVAFVPQVKVSTYYPGALTGQIVLFHEYAHHFLLGNYAIAYPDWFSEGYAEFASTMEIRDKVSIGIAAQHRASSLFEGKRLSATQLFDMRGRDKLSDDQIESIYARGWLLTHWMMFDPARREKFGRYLKAMNSGTPGVKAATDAFGDLGELDRELDRYLRQRTIPGMTLPLDAVPAPTVSVTRMSDGADAMMQYRIVSTRGVNEKTAAEVYRKAAPIAARYPDDPVVQDWFAEIASDAHDDAAAATAADKALAADPRNAHALIYKGLIAWRAADKAPPETRVAAWKAARGFFIRANRLDPDYAYPLALFFWSFDGEKVPPSASAIKGLYRAQELVPQDEALRWTAARQLLLDKEAPAARAMLAPLAYSPHAKPDNPATKAIAAIDRGDTEAALAFFRPEEKPKPASE